MNESVIVHTVLVVVPALIAAYVYQLQRRLDQRDDAIEKKLEWMDAHGSKQFLEQIDSLSHRLIDFMANMTNFQEDIRSRVDVIAARQHDMTNQLQLLVGRQVEKDRRKEE